MDIQTARAILAEAAAGNYLDRELPLEELDVIDLAQYYYDEAVLGHEEGMRDEHILAIIGLGSQVSPPVLSESADLTQQEETPPGEFNSWREVPQNVKGYPRRSSGGYSESDLRERENTFEPEDLPIPKPLPEVPYDMPTDLTEIGDKALRRLYSAFNAYSGRARWMLAISQSNLANATHLRDESYRAAYLIYHRRAQVEGEKLSQAILENLAKESDDYKSWEEKVSKHEKEVTNWRALSDIYSKNVEILSREWTMRTEQYERER